jgi:DNA-binding NarL/FixJ family response regulator
MLRYTRAVLERECGCWVATATDTGATLTTALERVAPDLLVVDTADFPECCRAALTLIPRDRVIVIGPEPDTAYRYAALSHGAGAWISRDRVGDDLAPAMRRILGCRHDPCPLGTQGTAARAAGTPGAPRTAAPSGPGP